MKYFTILILISLNIKKIFTELLDYSETLWPSTCKTNRQTPIDFPYPSNKTNMTYLPVNSTKIMFNTYTLVSNISMYQVVPDAKFAFKQKNMGELYFQKNGLFYRYTLIENHFHMHSEHSFNGTYYDLEMHLVHSKDNNFFFQANPGMTSDPDAQQQLLVIGILFAKNDNKTNLNSSVNNSFIQALKIWNPIRLWIILL